MSPFLEGRDVRESGLRGCGGSRSDRLSEMGKVFGATKGGSGMWAMVLILLAVGVGWRMGFGSGKSKMISVFRISLIRPQVFSSCIWHLR